MTKHTNQLSLHHLSAIRRPAPVSPGHRLHCLGLAVEPDLGIGVDHPIEASGTTGCLGFGILGNPWDVELRLGRVAPGHDKSPASDGECQP